MSTEVNVTSSTQKIIVDPATKSVSVVLAGPRGPSQGSVSHVELAGDTMTGPLILSEDATADLGAVTKQQMDAAIAAAGGGDTTPAGTFIMGGWETDPAGYLILDGSTVIGGAITYPGLASAFPSWVSGNDLILPNADGAVPLGSTSAEGVIAGSMLRNLTEAQLPAHHHSETQHIHTTPNHDHSVSLSGGGHSHTARFLITTSGSGSNAHLARPATYSYSDIQTITISNGSHSHSGTSGTKNPTTNQNAASNTGDTGSGSEIDITPKHLTVRFAVKT